MKQSTMNDEDKGKDKFFYHEGNINFRYLKQEKKLIIRSYHHKTIFATVTTHHLTSFNHDEMMINMIIDSRN
ncbi:hypothetical protein DERF_008630 [Dermatophagoides farinae]|uniref:Uncharacterized protein n=1 Tax=Dermatophagoides farinae TaxID=6954 RepID=A0A922I1C8_DERFA|nr:hypothetical protein DERF_008630 [Dermatophagoides farinae]